MHSPALLHEVSGTVAEIAFAPIRGLTVTRTVVPLGTPLVAISTPVRPGADISRSIVPNVPCGTAGVG